MSENMFRLVEIVLYNGREHIVTRIGGMYTSKGQVYRYDIKDLDNEVHRFDVSETEIEKCLS